MKKSVYFEIQQVVFIMYYRVFDNDRHNVLAYYSDQNSSFEIKAGGKVQFMESSTFLQMHIKLRKRSIEVLDGLVRKFATI